MRNILLVCLLFNSIAGIKAQGSNGIELASTIGLSNRITSVKSSYVPSGDFNPEVYTNFWNTREKSDLSYSIQLSYLKSFKKRSEFSMGIEFSAFRRHSRFEGTDNSEDPRLLGEGIVLFGDFSHLAIKIEDRFIDVPVGLKYYLNRTKTFYLKGVLNLGLYLNSQSNRSYVMESQPNINTKSVTRNDDYSNFNISPEVQFGYSYNISEAFFLNISLVSQISAFSGFKKSSPYIQRWYFLGTNVGIVYRL